MDGNYDYGAFPNQPNPPPPNVHPGKLFSIFFKFITNIFIGVRKEEWRRNIIILLGEIEFIILIF